MISTGPCHFLIIDRRNYGIIQLIHIYLDPCSVEAGRTIDDAVLCTCVFVSDPNLVPQKRAKSQEAWNGM